MASSSTAGARRSTGIRVGLLGLLVLGAVLLSCNPREAESDAELPDPGASRATPASAEVAAPRPKRNAPNATRLVMLGSGTPIPDPVRSGPAVAVVAQGQSYLVDFGPGVVRRLAAARLRGFPALDVARVIRVFVTHLHSDHTAGYPDLILTPAVVGRVDPLQVYGPAGIRHMTEAVLDAYREDLAMRRLQQDSRDMRGYGVEVHEVEPGLVYQDDVVKVTAFAVEHGAWEHAYGYRFDTPRRSIVISGDTAPTDAVIEACDGCDLLVHEVYCQEGLDRAPDPLRSYHPSYHTSGVELGRIAAKARAKFLVPYHVLSMNCSDQQIVSEVRRGYRGRVAMGRDLAVY